MSTSPSLHACTTATRAQLPSARVLCESLRRHHPDAEITVLVLDGPADFDAAGARSVSPLDVGVTPDLLARLAAAQQVRVVVVRPDGHLGDHEVGELAHGGRPTGNDGARIALLIGHGDATVSFHNYR